MTYINWVIANYQTILIAATSIVGAASMAVAAIAPLTKSDVDDRALSWIKRAHKLLSKIALNPSK